MGAILHVPLELRLRGNEEDSLVERRTRVLRDYELPIIRLTITYSD